MFNISTVDINDGSTLVIKVKKPYMKQIKPCHLYEFITNCKIFDSMFLWLYAKQPLCQLQTLLPKFTLTSQHTEKKLGA